MTKTVFVVLLLGVAIKRTVSESVNSVSVTPETGSVNSKNVLSEEICSVVLTVDFENCSCRAFSEPG